MTSDDEAVRLPEKPEDIIREMAKAGLELAMYASYAEIVGQVGHNRTQIRDWCDKVFALNGHLDGKLDAADVPFFTDKGALLQGIPRYETTIPAQDTK